MPYVTLEQAFWADKSLTVIAEEFKFLGYMRVTELVGDELLVLNALVVTPILVFKHI